MLSVLAACTQNERVFRRGFAATAGDCRLGNELSDELQVEGAGLTSSHVLGGVVQWDGGQYFVSGGVLLGLRVLQVPSLPQSTKGLAETQQNLVLLL